MDLVDRILVVGLLRVRLALAREKPHLKAKAGCFKCKKIGHLARDCQSDGAKEHMNNETPAKDLAGAIVESTLSPSSSRT
uniref:Putative secreted protein n=1 Tax=Anopheles triannulatus TaxID=58253 RepID=A0A2M4B368_9DIPT